MKTKIIKIVFVFAILLISLNCEKEKHINVETTEQKQNEIQKNTDFAIQPNVENVTLQQLNKDPKFNEIKNSFGILPNSTLSNAGKGDSYITQLVDSLEVTIAPNSLKKIVYDTYVSYTMLMVEPEDTSINFSNLVLQESNGIKKIFTIRYFPEQGTSKTSSFSSKGFTDSFNGDIQMNEGLTTIDFWNDPTQDGGGGGGGVGTGGPPDCEQPVTNCYSVNIWVPKECGCGHWPGQTCKGCNGNYPSYSLKTTEECQEICDWQNNSNNTSNNGGGTSGSDNNNDPTSSPNVLTSLIYPDAEIQQKIYDFEQSLYLNEQTYFNNPSNWEFKGDVINYLVSNNFSEENREIAKKAIGLFRNLDVLKFEFESPNFDPINTPWLDRLRGAAKNIEILLKDPKTPTFVKTLLITNLDNNLSLALTATALNYNINAFRSDETEKQQTFNQSGREGVGILLYEFANGKGPDTRQFNYSGDMVAQMFAGRVSAEIKADFLKELALRNWTFENFVSEGVIPSGYSFSPGHTTFSDSFSKHIRANDVQFFVGGANIKYFPSYEDGYIIVELMNPTSRNSLLLHIGDNYDRDGSNNGNDRPLSTITQTFRFKLKIN